MHLNNYSAKLQSLIVAAATLVCWSPVRGGEVGYDVGVAKIDITPAYPVRLNGFGNRRQESEGITQRIWAKALAIGSDEEKPVVLITIDNLGVRTPLVDEVAARLAKKAAVERARLAVTFTHTHTAPKVRGASDTIFSGPIPAEHQKNIDRYTGELTDALEKVALAALADRKPARLGWAVGEVGFAMNRRTPGGPVDHSLPMLVVRSADDDAIRAVYVTYACHCVTLSDNKISGDWAGFAQQAIEAKHAGVIAMVSIGCGSDANPNSGVTGANYAAAADQGAQIADEVERLLAGKLEPIEGAIETTFATIDLPLNAPPSREELERRARNSNDVGYNAQYQLDRLARGEPLPTKIDYPVQTWAFGDSLSMVFLGGEVCVDYSLRLKKELKADRVWLHGYSNDFCSYIPSERLLKEGGYGGGSEITYFGLPNTLAPGLEDKIAAEVKRQASEPFKVAAKRSRDKNEPLPLAEAIASLKVKDDLVVELAAAEPLVADPVAIDFGADGRLWVADMTDYSHEVDEKFPQTGSVRVLTDKDADGRYDDAVTFASGLRFPTDVKVWRNGVIVCDAPDVIYLEDADGDGKADLRKTLLTGFATHNAQARVNSLRWGLDNWLYGSGGLFGGQITTAGGKTVNLENRDFRYRPDTEELEAVTGRTQQGRTNDDWGNWFGCENGALAKYFPLSDHYLARNPHIAPPATELYVPAGDNPNQLFPIGELTLYELSGPPGLPTAACGIGAYRDELLGAEFSNNLFTAEPVNNLVHRMVLSPEGVAFHGLRAEDEADREFLASTDAWFRPVQVRTGPDGCLWIVDMHRAVIEHKRWIPLETLEELDVMAGQKQGRIYRVRPQTTPARPFVRLDKLSADELAAAIDSPNGPQRDLAHQMLVEREAQDAAPRLRELAVNAARPQTRLQALCALEGLQALDAGIIEKALADAHPAVRRHAIRLSEPFLGESPALAKTMLGLTKDDDPQVQLQLAYTLGEMKDPKAAEALAELAWRCRRGAYVLAGVWSSVDSGNVGSVVSHILSHAARGEVPPALLDPCLKLTAVLGNSDSLKMVADALASSTDGSNEPQRLNAAAELLQETRQGAKAAASAVKLVRDRVAPLIRKAEQAVEKGTGGEEMQVAALRLLEASGAGGDRLLAALTKLLGVQNSPAVQQAAAEVMASINTPEAGETLLGEWSQFTPATRAQVFEVVFSRRELLTQLLDKLSSGDISATDLDALTRQRLLTHPEPAIREAAAKALAGALDADRDKVVKSYMTSLPREGNAERGRLAFQKVCSSCHQLEGQGQSVGPDLAALTSRAPGALVESIFDPNRAVDERYQSFTALTVDGLVHAGVLGGETSTSVTLVEQGGKRTTLLRSELESFQNTAKSLMPEGLERDLSPEDAADVLAYLTAQRLPPKHFAGNKPQTVTPDAEGTLWLLSTNCEIYGVQIVFEAPFQNIGYWQGDADHVAWNIKLPQAGEYEAILHWACDNAFAGNAGVVEGGQPALKIVIEGTEGFDKYRTKRIGRLSLNAGTNRIVIRPDGPLTKPVLMDLRGLYLVPVGARADRAMAGNPPSEKHAGGR